MAHVISAIQQLLSTNGREVVRAEQTMHEESVWRKKGVGWGWGKRDTGTEVTYPVLPGILILRPIRPSGKHSQTNYNMTVKLFSLNCMTQDRLGWII